MRILVTGGAGFIGSHTVDALLACGHQVRVLDSLEPPVHNGVWPDYLPTEAELVRGDVTDPVVMRQCLEGVQAVFHFAAHQDYLPVFSRFFLVNSVGTAMLYELIVNSRLPVERVIIASSQAVYGEGKYRCRVHGVKYPAQRLPAQLERRDWQVRCPDCSAPMEPLWTDESVTEPHSSYGISKRDQDEIALNLGLRYDIPSVSLRYSIVQGPRQSFRNAYSGALRSFAVCVLNGRPPLMYEDGEQQRDYVSIHDVVEANLLALDDPRTDYQVYNVGGNRRVTVEELAGLVIGSAGAQVGPVCPGVYRVGDTRHIFSDISKLRALGWEPRVAQADMVHEYLAWVVEQPSLRNTFVEAEARMRATGVLRGASCVESSALASVSGASSVVA
jgi:dTDP-L-rhamnose 4-epimerase